MRFKIGLLIVSLFTMCIVLGPGTFADGQVLYGTILGTVTDASGAVVPGATVTATETRKGDSRTVSTENNGNFTLSTIPAGTYDISISGMGFSTYQVHNVIVSLNTAVRVDSKLTIGGQTESVDVSATAVGLQADRADVHEEVTARSLENLPQATRTYQGLIALIPGIAPPTTNTGGTNNPMRSMSISANGTSAAGTNVRIDGVSATNPWTQYYTTAVPSTEAIQAVNVVTSTSGADQGMANGAAVNVQLKNGTNSFHGSAYWYHLDNLLKARPYFLPTASRLPKFLDNNAGATLGGPIVPNRLFFFGSYEGDFLNQGSSTIVTVPTAAIRRGDMSGSANPIYDPLTGDSRGVGRIAFDRNVLPNSRISAIARKIAALIPDPNLPGVANNYFVNTPSHYKTQKIDTKIDYDATHKLHLFGRYSDYPYDKTQGTVFGPILGGANNAFENGNIYAFSVSGSYIVTPHFVIDGLFGLTHAVQRLLPPNTQQRYGSDVLGIPGTNLGDLPSGGGIPQFNVNNYAGYGYAYPALNYRDPVFQYTGNATWTTGTHYLRFGMEISQQQLNHSEVQPTFFTFTGGVTSRNGGASPNQHNSFADFLLGLPNTFQNSVQTVPSVTLRTYIWNPYVSDQWQVSPRVTLAVGTGWEYYPVPTRVDRGIEFFDLDTKQYRICGKGPISTDCGIHVQKSLFSPRIGLAFRATDSDVIRGGFSLNPEQINMYRDGLSSYPTVLTSSYSASNSFSAAGSLASGIPVPASPDITSGIVSLPPGITFTSAPKNFIRGYVESFNLIVEHDFGHQWLAQVGYVGSHTVHQHTRYNINYGTPGGGAASQPFYNGTLGTGITAAETIIYPFEAMNYNSLQGTFQHRFQAGSDLKVGYTWSKWMGTCCDSQGNGQPAIPIPQYFSLNYALMPGDRTHNLNISGVAVLPFGEGQRFLAKGAAGKILGGWSLNAILSFYSGSPFSVSADGTSLNAPGSTQRADQIKPRVSSHGNVSQYFDTSAFAAVRDARFGTASFNSLRGPGYGNADMGLFRTFPIKERVTLQARIEALNATNTPHFSNPNSNASSGAAFGTITATTPGSRTTDERYFRLGVKVLF